MYTNKEMALLESLRKETREQTQPCYFPGCPNNSIKSHIHQKKGPLNKIAVENKVVQLQLLTFFQSDKYGFRENSIAGGDVLTFFGFCNSCDTKIFDVIENDNADYSNYRHLLLFSYRGFLNELYKQEYNLKWYEQIEKNTELSSHVKQQYRDLNKKFSLSVNLNYKIKKEFEEELFEGSTKKNFDFFINSLPKIDICTSAVFVAPKRFRLQKGEQIPRELIIPYFINLIPTDNDVILILGSGMGSGESLINLSNLRVSNEKAILQLVSDILIKFIETWCISIPKFEELKSKGKDVEIIKLIQEYLPAEKKLEVLKFKLFDNITF